MRPVFDDLRRKVDAVVDDLPQGSTIPDVNDEFGDVFGSVYTLSGEGYSYAELKPVADELRVILLKEQDIGLFFKRARASSVLFGDATHHYRRVARLSGL